MTINDLRLTEVQISRALSGERTAQDLARELHQNPQINALSKGEESRQCARYSAVTSAL
jgi:hypothetical protein